MGSPERMTFSVATVVFPGGADAVPAVVVAGRVSPLGGLLAEGDLASTPRSVRDLVSGGDEWWERIALACGEADPASTWVSVDDVWFVPPVPDPPTIYCAGANYTDHIEEMSRTAPGPTAGAPYHFLVPSGALGGHRQMVWRPPGCTQLDWEVELAVVIGRRAEHVLVGDALEYVAGYTVANDVSMRDFALRDDVPFGVECEHRQADDASAARPEAGGLDVDDGPARIGRSGRPTPGHRGRSVPHEWRISRRADITGSLRLVSCS